MAFGLHGGQTHDAGDITQRLKDFYNLNDLEEVKFLHATTTIKPGVMKKPVKRTLTSVDGRRPLNSRKAQSGRRLTVDGQLL